jgi:hypothetical protein
MREFFTFMFMLVGAVCGCALVLGVAAHDWGAARGMMKWGSAGVGGMGVVYAALESLAWAVRSAWGRLVHKANDPVE